MRQGPLAGPCKRCVIIIDSSVEGDDMSSLGVRLREAA